MIDAPPDLPPRPEPKLDSRLVLYEPSLEFVDKSHVSKTVTDDGDEFFDQDQIPVYPTGEHFIKFVLPSDAPELPRYILIEGGQRKSGGIGVIYEFWDRKLGKRVMGKNADYHTDSAHLKTLMEARMTARFNHPNIVSVHSIGIESDGNAYYIMDLIEGNDLISLLNEDKFTLPQIISTINQAAQALSFIHQEGYIYADFKPGNIIIRPDGIIKLIDFGLTQKNVNNFIDVKTTTIRYASPELTTSMKATQSSDIYAFAVTVSAMLIDKKDFSRFADQIKIDPSLPEKFPIKNEFALIFDRHPELQQELIRIIYKYLDWEPAKRHTSVLELNEELQEVFKKLGFSHPQFGYPLFPDESL